MASTSTSKQPSPSTDIDMKGGELGGPSGPLLSSSKPQRHRRVFVGPFPERVIVHLESQLASGRAGVEREVKPSASATNQTASAVARTSVFSLGLGGGSKLGRGGDKKLEEVTQHVKDNVARFFVHCDGDDDESGHWGEEREEEMAERLVARWKESEWGQLWYGRYHHDGKQPGVSSTQAAQGPSTSVQPQAQAPGQWFGTSFEVGMLLGVDVSDRQDHLTDRSLMAGARFISEEDIIPPSISVVTSPPLEDYVTAPSTTVPGQNTSDKASGSFLTPTTSRTGLLAATTYRNTTSNISAPAFAVTSDNGNDLHMGPPVPSRVSSGAATVPEKDNVKGKTKMVHYNNSIQEEVPITPGPVPPGEVLGRTKETVDQNTSLAATTGPVDIIPPSPSPSDIRWGDVVLRDRMLVRVSYTKCEALSPTFNEASNRTTRDLQYEDWGEFLVAWRKDNIEVYRDHATPGKEWVTGHKHLEYVVPLKGKRTKLSLYSFVDLTFCVTCAPTTTILKQGATRRIFGREREGTNIFIFKVKCRSRAADWMWLLWRHMGGRIPNSIDVYNPGLNIKVTLDIPDAQGISNNQLYRLFERENILNLCVDLLKNTPDWKFLLERAIHEGKSLQLAWRSGVSLDWIWLERDIYGKTRHWAVLSGLSFGQGKCSPVLEVRLAEHEPTHLHLKNGKHLEEPPGIEGYLERIRPNIQTKQQMYLVTHNGNLFILNGAHANPPTPPGMAPFSNERGLRQAEVRRGINQIMNATGVCELRTIVAIRRAFAPAPTAVHDQKDNPLDDTAWFNIWSQTEQRTTDDEDDEGGEAGLNTCNDRVGRKTRRSFELLMNTGYVVRFEAHSCKVAIEWIERLRALIFYWKSRHRNDAKQEIEVAQARRPRLTPQTRVCQDDHEVPPEAPSDLSTVFPVMDTFYNWCVLEGCKPAVKSGKVYIRKGLRGQYKLFQLFLVAGHLIRFKIDPSSTLHRSVRKKINLADAYVCSGYFALQALPKGQYRTNEQHAARRYQDGLETDDSEEDMIFMLWYRSHPQIAHADQDPTVTAVETKRVPDLSTKHKVMIFKTRSNLERNSWCWAINSEIEKIVRAQGEREDRMRYSGNLIKMD